MKIYFKSCLLAIMIPTASFAMLSAPKYCPSVVLIKQNAFEAVIPQAGSGWVALAPPSQYDTQEEWGMSIALNSGPTHMSGREAVKIANATLSLITTKGELRYSQGLYWCSYFDDAAKQAVEVRVFPYFSYSRNEVSFNGRAMFSVF